MVKMKHGALFSKRGLWVICRKVMFVIFLSSSFLTRTYAQDEKVSFEVQNAKLTEIISILEKSTGYTFLYQDEQVAAVKNLTFRFTNERLSVVLTKCLAGTNLVWSVEDKTIVLKCEEKVGAQQQQVKSRKVSGRVFDETGQPLPGVTVMIEGTKLGTTTRVDGAYSIECSDSKNLVLLYSFMGMKSKRVVVGDKSVIDVKLEEDVTELEETVITGIYTRNIETFTGSVSTFKAEDLKQIGPQNVLRSLSVLDPSFIIMENRAQGSNPNALMDISINGKINVTDLSQEYSTDPNQPLFILDGFEVSAEKIFDLDPNRVSSITVLKDAAATAIYGSRAANGVVVVETKAPEMGELRVSYHFSGDFNFADLSDYNLMNASEKLEYEQLAGLYSHPNIGMKEELQEAYNERLKLVQQGVNTDWMKKPIHALGFSHKHSLLLEGGDARLRYGLDLN